MSDPRLSEGGRYGPPSFPTHQGEIEFAVEDMSKAARDQLKSQLVYLLKDIGYLIQYQEQRLLEYGDNKYQVVDTSGRPLFADLFVAKANILAALVRLETTR
jgi:hypothetical protein